MFFKKKINLKRGAVLYCGEHEKKVQMILEHEAVDAFGPINVLEGKEIWKCPKCLIRRYVNYRIDVTKTSL